MTRDHHERGGPRRGDGFDRRRFLEAAGAASLPALAGCAGLDPEATDTATADRGNVEPTERPGNSPPDSKTLELRPDLELGGRLVVGAPDAPGYDTITGAWEAAVDGDVIFVHSSYDAEAADEPFPVTLDYTEKEVMLSGGHPSGSVIDARHTDENAIEILGKGFEDYRNKALVQHLKVLGGNTGVRIRSAPYSTYKDLVVYNTGDDGVRVEGYTDERGKKGSFGITFRNCMAWRCSGAGFRLDPKANPHGTTFYGCQALWNGLGTRAPGVQLRGYASRWQNGVIQNNGGYGLDARAGPSQGVNNAYLEGNGMALEHPHGVFVDDTSPGFVLSGSYFQGGYFRSAPNGRDKGYRGVGIVGAEGIELSACTYKNYTDAFCHLRDTTDADVHVTSHTALDDTRFQNSWNNQRLRSNGLVMETDLRGTDPSGRFRGDYGIHDGSGRSPWGLALWNGNRWVSVMDGSTIG